MERTAIFSCNIDEILLRDFREMCSDRGFRINRLIEKFMKEIILKWRAGELDFPSININLDRKNSYDT